MAFPTGWARKQKITIQSSEVSGAGSYPNFPVLITLDHLNAEIVDAGLNSALNGGGDVRFSSDSAGNTQLACEIVEFVVSATPGSRKVTIWVKVPSISTSVNTDFYIWYNKSGESLPVVSNPFGRNAVWSDYPFVSHDGGETDSTGNTTPTEIGSPTNAIGPFGTSNGAREWASKTTNAGYTTGIMNYDSFTLQAWAQPQGSIGDALIVGIGNSTFTDYVVINSATFDNDYAAYSTSAGQFMNVVGETLNSWSSLSMTLEDGVGGVYYIDGVSGDTDALFNSSAAGKTTLTCGYTGLGVQNWEGLIAEVRLRDEVFSSGWIATEYANQNTPNNFAVAGVSEAATGNTVLVVNAGGVSTGADNVILIQAHIMLNDETSHGHICDAITVIENTTLQVNDGASSLQSNISTINQLTSLDIGKSLHESLASNVDITQFHNLEIVVTSHNHLTGNISINEGVLINLVGAYHSHAVDNIILGQLSELPINAAKHTVSSNQATLTGNHILVTADVLNNIFNDIVTLTTENAFEVHSSVHGFLSSGLTLGYSVNLSVADNENEHFADRVLITQNHVMAVAQSDHNVSSSNVEIEFPVVVDETNHLLINGAPNLSQVNHLLLESGVHTHFVGISDVRVPPGVWGQLSEAIASWSINTKQPTDWVEKNQSVDDWSEK